MRISRRKFLETTGFGTLAAGAAIGAEIGKTGSLPKRALGRTGAHVSILAMGGEGGGVLASWIVDVAESAGCFAQMTSVPGVAQRTGSTVYYLELFSDAGREPVLALMPVPGEVDIVIASELMEAGRSILRGLVTPDRSTLIASTHRLFATAEKEKPGDAIADPNAVMEAAGVAAKRVIAFDLEAVAAANGSVISACMFGALAGRGINISMINTSEVRVSVVVERPKGPEALACLKEAFAIG